MSRIPFRGARELERDEWHEYSKNISEILLDARH
jgi:hypothetical protein